MERTIEASIPILNSGEKIVISNILLVEKELNEVYIKIKIIKL